MPHQDKNQKLATIPPAITPAPFKSDSQEYPELSVVFNFFTDNPQKAITDAERISLQTGREQFYDPYWERIRDMQANSNFLEGILLKSVDCKPRYPYVQYTIYNGENSKLNSLARKSHDFYQANSTGHEADTEFGDILKSKGSYKELHTFVDRNTPLLPKRPSNPNTAYILTAFMTSGNLDNLDKTWSYWSGADYIVENIPACLKLERITFHKTHNPTTTGFSYVLLCELGEALADLNRAREFIDHLKFRQCGISLLYVIDHFF